MPSFNGVIVQFTTASTHYAAAIEPYALKLFVSLLFIDVLVTAIQFFLDQGDAPHYVGRLIRHLLSGGFVYLMIVNAFPWMTTVLQSFSRIGAAATGLPNLNPSTVLKIGGTMAETIFDSPANASLMPNLELAIVQTVSAFFVLIPFVVAAAALLLTLVESYLVVGGAVILLGFGASRWTASIAEGYFGYVIRVGTRLLFFYLVLGIGVQIATQWQAALTAACNPVATPLPWYATYGAAPKTIITSVCSNVIPVRTMLDLMALSIVFLIVTLAVPHTAASIVSGTVGLALSHAFEAVYLAQTVVRPITSTLQGGFNRISRIGSSTPEQASVPGPMELAQYTRRTAKLADASPQGPTPGRRATGIVTASSHATAMLAAKTNPISQSNGTSHTNAISPNHATSPLPSAT